MRQSPMVRRILVFTALLAPLAAMAADPASSGACATPSQNTDVRSSIDAAASAFGDLDLATFQSTHAETRAKLACLNEPISRSTAAEFHRMEGLSLFMDRNKPEAVKSFAAARAIEPNYVFPSDLVPEGNPVIAAYTELDPDAGAKEMLPRPKVGSVKVDGSGSLERNSTLPAIVQLFDGTGAVTQTVLLKAGEPVPSYDVPDSAAPEKPPKAKGGGPNVPLLIAGGASLAVAGGLYGGGAVTRGAWKNATSVADADRSRGTTNALVVASGVAGAVGVGLGTTSFVLSGRF
ncbi:MAG: hypothetical protein R3F61_02720 [Myxococcota bacterium]